MLPLAPAADWCARRRRHRPLADLEVTSLRGWCRMVDYLWAAAWPSDFTFMTAHGLDVLPESLLTPPEAWTRYRPKLAATS